MNRGNVIRLTPSYGLEAEDEAEVWDRLPHTLEERGGAGVPRSSNRAVKAWSVRKHVPQKLPVPFTEAWLDTSPGGAIPKLRNGSRAQAQRQKGPCKRAALLDAIALRKSEQWIDEHSRCPASDRLKLRLSVHAGLRACEIAALPLNHLLDAHRRIGNVITVHSSKTNTTRQIAMHPLIADAVSAVMRCHPEATHAAFSVGAAGVLKRQSASCVANWFARIYRSAGLVGCSSHSGRRTFATHVARQLGGGNGSIADLQKALGHASLNSTQCYLEPSDAFGDIIRNLSFTGHSQPPRQAMGNDRPVKGLASVGFSVTGSNARGS